MYVCNIWNQTKRLNEKTRLKLHDNATSCLKHILEAASQYQLLFRHSTLIPQTFEVNWARLSGHCWWRKEKLIIEHLLRTSTNGRTNNKYFLSSMRTLGSFSKICQMQWLIEKDSQRKLWDSILPVWLYDHIYISIYVGFKFSFTKLFELSRLSFLILRSSFNRFLPVSSEELKMIFFVGISFRLQYCVIYSSTTSQRPNNKDARRNNRRND